MARRARPVGGAGPNPAPKPALAAGNQWYFDKDGRDGRGTEDLDAFMAIANQAMFDSTDARFSDEHVANPDDLIAALRLAYDGLLLAREAMADGSDAINNANTPQEKITALNQARGLYKTALQALTVPEDSGFAGISAKIVDFYQDATERIAYLQGQANVGIDWDALKQESAKALDELDAIRNTQPLQYNPPANP